MSNSSTIIYTKTDEAPALASHSLLPILRAFTSTSGVKFESKDISLAGRILAHFPESLSEDQRVSDALSELGILATTPEANIIKLPNVSASIPQLKEAIKELQSKGFSIPAFPDDPLTEEEKSIRSNYAKVLGSAVNPVLREGNSDRRVAKPVKEFAQKNPHSMGPWTAESKTHVAHMEQGDFYGSESSHTIANDTTVRIQLDTENGETLLLKDGLILLAGEVIDASAMNSAELRSFLAHEIKDAKEKGVLFSLHMKATMMKVSDPIIFGHCVSVFYKDILDKYSSELEPLAINLNNGSQDLFNKIQNLPADLRSRIEIDIEKLHQEMPELAMVNSDKGISNLHVPSDIIIDASMPAMIRNSGQMWGPDGQAKDTKAVIPDRNYASVFQETISFCKENGAFDVTTMGNVSNVGLMAKKAEEYGSHDKTFEVPQSGTIRVVDQDGSTLLSHPVEIGDVWRMCQTKDVAIKDWVKLAVSRARATGAPALFWLDSNRAHDRELIKKINAYLPEHDTEGLDIQILAPAEATRKTCRRCKDGLDTISVTGNVLRDYLTDLFPILELGTSAKMLSIVPLLAGGGLFETGAGGSAPKHVQQFLEEGHLRWDSLGEFLAIGVSLEDLAEKTDNAQAKILADCLNQGIGKFLDENKSPSRKVNELDNRGSHFYLALFWAEALATQELDAELKNRFSPLAQRLRIDEKIIVSELIDAQGVSVDLEGYYLPNEEKAAATMRPSQTFNQALASLN
jgi:isocitrate dehydrogenase